MYEILYGARKAHLLEFTLRLGIALLRLVSQAEERLLAPGLRTGARYPQHLLGGQVRPLAGTGRMGKDAVAAVVAAELGQGDEDLARVRDAWPKKAVPNLGRRPSRGLKV